MGGRARGLRWLVPVTAVTLACGKDPQPLTGKMTWTDGCALDPMGASCPSGTHVVSGAAGSPNVLVDCTVTQISGGYRLNLVAATLQPGETNFDETTEGISINGQVSGGG